MKRVVQKNSYRGECVVASLTPYRSNMRNFFRQSTEKVTYDFGQGIQVWQKTDRTLGYVLPEAVIVEQKHRDRMFAGLLVTRTGHIAVGGVLSGWRLDQESQNHIFPDQTEHRSRLVIPEDRLIDVSDWPADIGAWPQLTSWHTLPLGQMAKIRYPDQAIEAFREIGTARSERL